jgi:uncharacterized protein (TIGR04255 family)
MSDQPSLPRFRKPPVSEVAIGVQFQTPVLTPVHLGLYYQAIKGRFPVVTVQPPLQPTFETFETTPTMMLPFPFPFQGMTGVSPRMWFGSEGGSSLIQLQPGRLLFNWRGGLEDNAYPHFNAVQTEFMSALDALEELIKSEGLVEFNVNQCELTYINSMLFSSTGVPLSEPQKIFRIWSGVQGDEWKDAIEDLAFTLRYKFNDESGNPFGRLTATLSSGIAGSGIPAFQLEMTARGRPVGDSRAGVVRFHDHAHEAIVRCFTAITTPEMHERWERYQ